MAERKGGFLQWFASLRQPTPGKVADRFSVAVTDTRTGTTSAGNLPDPGEPKLKGKGGVATPTIFDTARPDTGSAMTQTDRASTNLDLTTLRNTGSTKENIAIFAKVNPELSSAVDAYVRLALRKYTVVAYDRLTGEMNPDATRGAWAWLRSNDFIGNYAEGFVTVQPIRQLLESLAHEMRYYGSCMVEVVLNAARVPDRIVPIGTRDLEWWPTTKSKAVIPVQDVEGNKVRLDYPTIIYTALDQDLYYVNSDSPMEPALQPVLMAMQFLNDVRRVIRGAIHPRLKVTIDEELIRKAIPPEIQANPEKSTEWMDSIIAGVTEMINGLEPEEALVMMDFINAEYLTRGNVSLDREYTQLDTMSTGKITAGAKTLPSVVGRGANQTTASVESMIFIKQVEGALQAPLNTVMSRAMTLISRLGGADVYVEFKLNDIDLRPESELAGFRSQQQARILEQLSLGLITDDEASVALTGKPAPAGMAQLSGTMFYKADASAAQNNNYSNTAAGGAPGQDGGGGALNENLSPKTSPNKAGSN